MDGRPRRFLVKLQTEETAAALLEVAPSLRYSSDEFIAANVYINPDLSPLASKLAYEARLKRHEYHRRHSLPASHTKAVDVNTPRDAPSSSALASAAVYNRHLSDNCVGPVASASTYLYSANATSSPSTTATVANPSIHESTTAMNPLSAEFNPSAAGSCD